MSHEFRTFQGKDGKLRPDFSQFDPTGSGLDSDFSGTINSFAKLVVSGAKLLRIGEISSNVFKNEMLYDRLVRDLGNQEKGKHPDQQPSGQLQLLTDQEEAESRANPVSDYVRLAGNIFPVDSDAQAIARIAEYILSNYSIPEDILNDACGTWISYDPSAASSGSGYFRGAPRRIRLGSRMCWIGTASNTAAKRRQIKRLCELAPVKQGEVEWYKNGNIQFPM